MFSLFCFTILLSNCFLVWLANHLVSQLASQRKPYENRLKLICNLRGRMAYPGSIAERTDRRRGAPRRVASRCTAPSSIIRLSRVRLSRSIAFYAIPKYACTCTHGVYPCLDIRLTMHQIASAFAANSHLVTRVARHTAPIVRYRKQTMFHRHLPPPSFRPIFSPLLCFLYNNYCFTILSNMYRHSSLLRQSVEM